MKNESKFIITNTPSDNRRNLSLVRDRAVKYYPAVNGASSVVELVAGLASGNVSLAVDGMHGTAEIVIANAQIGHAHEHDHIGDKKRKRIYTALSALALGGASVASLEATGQLNLGFENRAISTIGWLAAATSASSAVLAGKAIIRRAKEKYGGFWRAPLSETEHDVSRHIIKLDAPSSLLALLSSSARLAGYYMSSRGYVSTDSIEHFIGIGTGLWGTYLFRPTKSNLEHHHANPSVETMPPEVERMEQL